MTQVLRTIRSDAQAALYSRLVIFAAVLLVLSLTAASAADSIRVRGSVYVETRDVTLAQIAELTGTDAQALGDIVVGRAPESGEALTVNMRDVRASLSDGEVNWGLVTLRGYQRCRVRRTTPSEADASAATQPADPASGNASDASTSMTATGGVLRERIESILQKLAGVPRDKLRITFREHDADRLGRSALQGRFEIVPGATSAIGRVPVTVRRYDAGRPVETFSVTADVKRRATAVVVTEHMSRGDRFARPALKQRTVWLTDEREPMADPSIVADQQAAATLESGTIVYPDHVRSPVLVKRGELVTVRCLSGSLVVRTVGRASEEGAMDETIRIRNEGSNETFHATVTGRREAVVRINKSEKHAAKPQAAAGKAAAGNAVVVRQDLRGEQ